MIPALNEVMNDINHNRTLNNNLAIMPRHPDMQLACDDRFIGRTIVFSDDVEIRIISTGKYLSMRI